MMPSLAPRSSARPIVRRTRRPSVLRFGDVPVTTPSEFTEALAGGNFDRLIGTAESNWLDFKLTGYAMQDVNSAKLSAKGRWELCKDVAELANQHGGYLVLGVNTEKQPTVGIEVASQIRPIRIDLINIEAYRAVVRSGVYPAVRDLRLKWYFENSGTANDKGLLLIDVPPQSDTDRPFVVRQMYNDDLGKETGAVGIPVRNGDQTDWYSAERIHHRINAAEQGPSGPPNTPVGGASPHEIDANAQADERLQHIEDVQDWADDPIYFLQALPPDPVDELPGFYGATGVAQTLLRPASLRPGGFNLSGFGQGEWLEGALVVRRMDDAAAWLDPNGMFSIGVAAGPAFLGWGINPGWQPGKPIRINSVTLVEFTLEVCRFVHYALRPHKESPGWSYRLRCVRFKESVVSLGPGAPRKVPLPRYPVEQGATSDTWEKRVGGLDDPSTEAFRVLSAFYGLFALGEDDIPFRKGDRIDEVAVRDITG